MSGDRSRLRKGTGPRVRAGIGGKLAVVLACLALAVVAGADSTPGGPRFEAVAVDATGAVSISNALEGRSILSPRSMRPGESASGTVTIKNAGSAAADFTLSKSSLNDVPGIGGGILSSRLELRVEDVTAEPVTLYSGKLAAMGILRLQQAFRAGERRTYRFTAVFVDGGLPPSPTTGDNAFKGSLASVQFDWGAQAKDDPGPPPPPSPAPAPAPAPEPAAKPPADAGAPVVRAPSLQRLGRRGFVPITITCTEACRIMVRARLTGSRALKKVKLKRLSVSIPRGTSAKKITVKLSRKAVRAVRKALRAKKKVALMVEITVKDDTGKARRTTSTIRLRS